MIELEDGFKYEMLVSFDEPIKISFSIDAKKQETLTNGIFVCNLYSSRSFSVFCLKLIDPNRPDEFCFVPFDRLTSKITLPSGDKFHAFEFLRPEIIELIKSGFFNQKIKKNANSVDDALPIVWAGEKSVEFSYPYQGGSRELRLDRIMYNPNQDVRYWKCFCYLRKMSRTFKETSIAEPLTCNGVTYSKAEFLQNVLNLNPDDLP